MLKLCLEASTLDETGKTLPFSLIKLNETFTQGFSQDEAYEIVEEQDRKTRDYRQIERLLAMEQVHLTPPLP